MTEKQGIWAVFAVEVVGYLGLASMVFWLEANAVIGLTLFALFRAAYHNWRHLQHEDRQRLLRARIEQMYQKYAR